MKKKVTILANEMGYSGVEREIVSLANSLVSLYDVEILFNDLINENANIDPKVKVVVKKPKLFESISFYSELLKNIDVVIATDVSFFKYVIRFSKGKKIYWTHEVLDDEKNLKLISKFDSIVVSNKMLKDYYEKFNHNTIIINDAIVMPGAQTFSSGDNLIFIGKLTKDKNLGELLDVYSKVKERVETSLTIIGIGEERKSLEELVKKKQLKDVYFKGLLDQEEVRQELLNSALYVTCGESDTSNLSILEAMSYGIPVIAFDSSDFSSFIIDDINGYLIENRNKDKMSEVIIELLKNSSKRREFSNCAKEKVEEFDINSIKIEWIKIF